MPFSGIFSDIIRYSNVIFPIPDDVIVIIALPQFCIISPPVHLFYPTDICVGGHGFEPVHYIANGCTVFFIVYSIFIIRCEMNDWFIRCGAFGCFNLGKGSNSMNQSIMITDVFGEDPITIPFNNGSVGQCSKCLNCEKDGKMRPYVEISMQVHFGCPIGVFIRFFDNGKLC